MKKVVIYTTEDKVISLQLVYKIISNPKYKDFKFDIYLTKPKMLRKIKIFIVLFLFGSLKDFFKKLNHQTSVSKILKSNRNCKVITEVKKKYDFGLSVYCSSKIKVEKFKIYNFHLGSLKNQRGSFIFFYKFIKNWNEVSLTFHEISDRFDVGEIINERKINLNKSCVATDIFFIYLKNLDFLDESINKIKKGKRKKYNNFEKLNLVPSFFKLFKEILKYYLILKKNN